MKIGDRLVKVDIDPENKSGFKYECSVQPGVVGLLVRRERGKLFVDTYGDGKTVSGPWHPSHWKPHKRPHWIRRGRWVTWRGQEEQCFERILRVTEPQPGNYVLWTTLDGKARFGRLHANHPINHKQVAPCAKPRI
jgi:hypothetical protein